VDGRPENEEEVAIGFGRGTCKPDCADHWRLIDAELGAGPRFEIDELDLMRPPFGRSPASIAAVSGVLIPLCLLLELGVCCKFGDPSLPNEPARLEPICVDGRLVVPESESAMMVLVGER
jgi:hypothetical protein